MDLIGQLAVEIVIVIEWRSLLRGMEQARRATMAHHVHRFAPMGARVLINENWY
jgi:hypothetical protein